MLDLDPIRKRAGSATKRCDKIFSNRKIRNADGKPDALPKREKRLLDIIWRFSREDIPLLIAEVERLREYEKNLRAGRDMQTEDEGLWFKAERATEGYLQRALRRIHALIEGDKDALERIALTDKEEFFE